MQHNSEKGANAITEVNEKFKRPYSKCKPCLNTLTASIETADIARD